jgi:hypothetical protein
VARLPPATRDDVPDGEQGAYDECMQSRGSRPHVGPSSLLLHLPERAHRFEALRTSIRGEARVPQKRQAGDAKPRA